MACKYSSSLVEDAPPAVQQIEWKFSTLTERVDPCPWRTLDFVSKITRNSRCIFNDTQLYYWFAHNNIECHNVTLSM